MQIIALEVKNFRCFTMQRTVFTKTLTLIEGPNGSGKSSLLEALHYACHGKSFRTSNADELIQHTAPNFFIKIELRDQGGEYHTIQIGLSSTAKSIKVDGKKITTYKELVQHYRAITITEDDVQLIKGSPEFRRGFLDQMVMLHYAPAASSLKRYRAVLKQRNALLSADEAWNSASYELWTERLWDLAAAIRLQRTELLARLEQEIQRLAQRYFPELPLLTLSYKLSSPLISAEAWVANNSTRERQARRTLFGPHLDDFEIVCADKPARQYASRGQQKLLAVLLKVAHFFLLDDQSIILLDDFMTDFDDTRAYALLDLFIHKKVHLICTVPTPKSPLALHLATYGAEHLELSLEALALEHPPL